MLIECHFPECNHSLKIIVTCDYGCLFESSMLTFNTTPAILRILMSMVSFFSDCNNPHVTLGKGYLTQQYSLLWCELWIL